MWAILARRIASRFLSGAKRRRIMFERAADTNFDLRTLRAVDSLFSRISREFFLLKPGNGALFFLPTRSLPRGDDAGFSAIPRRADEWFALGNGDGRRLLLPRWYELLPLPPSPFEWACRSKRLSDKLLLKSRLEPPLPYVKEISIDLFCLVLRFGLLASDHIFSDFRFFYSELKLSNRFVTISQSISSIHE